MLEQMTLQKLLQGKRNIVEYRVFLLIASVIMLLGLKNLSQKTS